jgi:hypothetical protein
LSSSTLAGAACLVAAVAVAAPAAAQQRRLLSRDDPQSHLLGFYAATMNFTPVGLPKPGFAVGGALGVVPSLSLEDRTVGFGGTKAQDANRCPVFPRLTAQWMARAGFAVEAGYTPAANVCGVEASVYTAAASYRFSLAPTWDGVARLSMFSGTVEGDLTCSASDTANAANQTCYGGSPSSDRMAPSGYGIDMAFAYRGDGTSRLEPYAIIGFNREGIDFDVNYTRTAAQGTAVGGLPPLTDNNRLRAELTRVHAGVGAGWTPLGWLALGGELYYEPGAMLTLRGSARARFGVPR